MSYVNQAAIIIPQNTQFGPSSQLTLCPYCHARVTTSVENKATTKTHIAAVLLFCFCCWPCCCCPYCMDSCQNTNHYCPNCRSFLGTYQS